MPIFAAVDIGSNSCRLKISQVVGHRLKTLYEDREVVRLGESVFQTGMISPDAMAVTIKALKRFHKAVQGQVVDKVRVVATSAMRDARNAAAFVEWVKSDTGWDVEVISGLEEGRLIHLGVVTHEPGAKGKVLLIDLGGGSCEVTVSDKGRVQKMVSLPLGAVRLQQEFLQNDPPTKEDLERLRQYIERELERGGKDPGQTQTGAGHCHEWYGLGAGGGQRCAGGKVDSQGPGKGRVNQRIRQVQAAGGDLNRGARVSRPAGNDDQRAARAAVPGIGPKRSEIIVGGAAVYARLLERLGLGGFRYSTLGLRDGISWRRC